jgi:hypothetical protein
VSGDDVYDFIGSGRAKKMIEEADPEEVGAVAGAAAAGAEASKEPRVPINEVTYITTVRDDTSSAPADTAKAKKSKNAIGARAGFGNAIGIGSNIKIDLGGADRIDAGIDLWTTIGKNDNGFGAWGFEALGFYEWHSSISNDGALGLYGGPGVAFGFYGTPGKGTKTVTVQNPANGQEDSTYTYTKKPAWNIGLGGQFGLDVNFSFIDPDHSLYSMLKDAAMSFDIRPMIYLPEVVKEHWLIITFGISFRYRF